MNEVMTIGTEQTMSSLQIAELTGKEHHNIMKAIRKMEPAWEKINGVKFNLVDYTDRKGAPAPGLYPRFSLMPPCILRTRYIASLL